MRVVGGESTETVAAKIDERTDIESAELHSDALVIDALDVSVMNRDHIRHLIEGGVTAINYTITLADGPGLHDTIDRINELEGIIQANGDLIQPVRSAADIMDAKQRGRVGVIYGFQNATPIEGDLRLITTFVQLGVRIIQLTYMSANLLADGCLEPRNAGLTGFGRAAIREMNRTGVLVDLSHVGERSTLESIDESELPVAITHAGAWALCQSPRNKSDEVMKALARRGGVLGVPTIPYFLAADPRKATLETYLDHIEYAVQTMGIDSVGLGTDCVEFRTPENLMPHSKIRWGGTLQSGLSDWGLEMLVPSVREDKTFAPLMVTRTPGLEDHRGLPAVTRGLLARGMRPVDIAKILGQNFLRLFRDVWGS